MHIHATGSHSARTPYSLHFINEETIAVYGLVMSDVFKDFPQLKVVVSHGGGSIPYQIGRFQSSAGRRGIDFLDGMRHLYYDTVLYSEEALRLLIKTVGADRCLFGSECPGVGSTLDPATGRTRDDIRPVDRQLRLAQRGRQAAHLRRQCPAGLRAAGLNPLTPPQPHPS